MGFTGSCETVLLCTVALHPCSSACVKLNVDLLGDLARGAAQMASSTESVSAESEAEVGTLSQDQGTSSKL